MWLKNTFFGISFCKFFFLSKIDNNFNIFLSNLIFDNNILLLPFEVSFSLHGHIAALHLFPNAPTKVTSPRCKKLVQNICKVFKKFCHIQQVGRVAKNLFTSWIGRMAHIGLTSQPLFFLDTVCFAVKWFLSENVFSWKHYHRKWFVFGCLGYTKNPNFLISFI